MIRLRKGDRVVVAHRPLFAASADGLIPIGTTGTVVSGGRWNAQVEWDQPDRNGRPTTRSAERPYIALTDQVQLLGEEGEWCLHCGSDTCSHAARHNAAYGGTQ